ncbi:uncharacterized protein [Argopecten irradians]|uniref:uncharacterized protein isoform X2 n=1 Tax=Argopecten irradians TaxID=31199 RepID=UPI003710A3D5
MGPGSYDGIAVDDLTLCSEYLVSGLDGVKEADISASTSFDSEVVPKYSRLYTETAGMAWGSRKRDLYQYIQVDLHRETTVYAVHLQGRGKRSYPQYVKTYFVSFSNDSVTWINVTSSDGSSKLLTGNSDTNTVVKADIDPTVTGRYFRINPQSWHNHISLRFDISGCYRISTAELTVFSRVPIVTSPSFTQGMVLNTSSASISECSNRCKKIPDCTVFTFYQANNICHGFNVIPGPYGKFSSLASSALSFAKSDIKEFNKLEGTSKTYKVMEVTGTQSDAEALCGQYSSGLIRIDNVSEMSALQSIITANVILSHHFKFFVSGEYINNQWQYSRTSTVIGSDLWSPGNPDSGAGHCVMLTTTGLVSTECTSTWLSVCGIR